MTGMIAHAEMQAIEQRCASVVRRALGLERTFDLGRATAFVRLGADSIDMVSITMGIEEEFGFEVSDDEAAACDTFGAVLDLVARRLASLNDLRREGWMAI